MKVNYFVDNDIKCGYYLKFNCYLMFESLYHIILYFIIITLWLSVFQTKLSNEYSDKSDQNIMNIQWFHSMIQLLAFVLIYIKVNYFRGLLKIDKTYGFFSVKFSYLYLILQWYNFQFDFLFGGWGVVWVYHSSVHCPTCCC